MFLLFGYRVEHIRFGCLTRVCQNGRVKISRGDGFENALESLGDAENSSRRVDNIGHEQFELL